MTRKFNTYDRSETSPIRLRSLILASGMAGITFPIIFLFGFCMVDVLSQQQRPETCYPAINPAVPQFVVGYGSLINNASKLRTDPTAGPSIPVTIHGYRRLWDAQGSSRHKFSTTFLGIRHDPSSSFNAVIFPVFPSTTNTNPIGAYDFREDWYCRQRVNPDQIHFLSSESRNDQSSVEIEKAKEGEIWIYVTRSSYSALPDETHPIRLSYVDTFLTGCLEIEEEFKLKDFAANCVSSTDDWGNSWLNTRDSTVTGSKLSLRDRVDALLASGVKEYPKIEFRLNAGAQVGNYLHLVWQLGVLFVITRIYG